jgi:hypothetical protein
MLRKVSYREYYEDDIMWTDPPHIVRDHIGQ